MRRLANILYIIWRYFAPSWEDELQQFSYKRASAFMFAWLIAFMVLKSRVVDKWTFYTFLTLSTLFAVVAAIITVPQLIKLTKAASGFKLDNNEDTSMFPGSSNTPDQLRNLPDTPGEGTAPSQESDQPGPNDSSVKD